MGIRFNFKVGDLATCTRCKGPFPVTEYNLRSSKYMCSPCQVALADEWTRKNRDKKRTANRKYARKVSGKRSEKTASYRRRNPEKAAAHQAVGTAKRNGSLMKEPCEKCGDRKANAHHDDYQKPLDVRWLCHKCHMKEHGRYDEQQAALLEALAAKREEPKS